MFLDTTQTEPVCAGWEPIDACSRSTRSTLGVRLGVRLDGPEYRVCASGLPAGGGAVALARAVLPDARSLGWVCLFVCSLVCLFGVFACGGPVRSGRARAGTSPARSEGPLGVHWVLTHGARRPSAGWLRAHSDTQTTRRVHACPSAPLRVLGYPGGYSVSTLCVLRRQSGSARCRPLPFAYSGTPWGTL